MSTSNFQYKELSIKHISKASLKNSYINITNEAEIIIKTPRVSQSFMLKLLQERESWIRKKLHEIKQNMPIKVNLEDEVLLFGDLYSIDMPEASTLRAKLQRIKINSTQNTIKCYDSFYKEYSTKYITPRVEFFSKEMNLNYNEIKFRKMKRRWGSCSSKKILTFNTELIKTNKELIDYVIVHELAHLKHMNHSKKFHLLVEKYLPNSKHHRSELKKTKLSTF
ncbi:M48 family metallopeptidase [Sulfurimonas sp.]